MNEFPQYRGFTITLRHATFNRTALDEWSSRHGECDNKQHSQETDFRDSNPKSQQGSTYALDLGTCEIGMNS